MRHFQLLESILIRRCGDSCRCPDMAIRDRNRPCHQMAQAMEVARVTPAARVSAMDLAQALVQVKAAIRAAGPKGFRVVVAQAGAMETIPMILIESFQRRRLLNVLEYFLNLSLSTPKTRAETR